MSDRIAVMNAGRIEQLDTAEELYERPNTRFVAQFLGSCNLLNARLVKQGAEGCEFASSLGPLRWLPPTHNGETERARERLARDADVTLAIRPEKIRLTKTDELGFANCVKAHIEDIVYSGAETQYRLRAGEQALSAVALNARVGHQGFDEGETVLCYLPESALVLLDD
jgi:spermidine/putrescine transport system ATP-binding protein